MLRRGIEPIIATVILVAVALVIAVAVVGYLMGLFGGLTGGQPQITITGKTAKIDDNKLKIELYINNAGAGSDKLLRVEIIYGGASSTYYFQNSKTLTGTGTAPGETIDITTAAADKVVTIGGNYRGWLVLRTANNYTATPGDTIILKLYFERSGVQTIPITISP